MNQKEFINNYINGKEYEAAAFFGGHLMRGGKAIFRTFAPNASRVALIAECSNWQEIPMVQKDGIYICEVVQAWEGMMYKYRIYHKNGKCVDHCDPFGFYMEERPRSASRLWKTASASTTKYTLKKTRYIREDITRQALNIYELHPGSFLRTGRKFLSYEALGKKLIPYLKRQGYNAIEFLPLQEHPMDGSWGYQGTGLYAPTSRYGTPKQFKSLVQQCHRNGIKVIIDFVTVHFAVDYYALKEYDGTRLFEHKEKGPWGSYMYNHDSGMVRSFLKSAAWFWANEYQIDGIRFDAVSNLIHWHGDESKWYPGGMQFLREITQGLKERDANLYLIAEDSTSYDFTTKPVSEGGLGFDDKWAMGWRYDTFDYLSKAPEERISAYSKMTFSMDYFYHGRYLLPISHDEIGGRDGQALVSRMYGKTEKEKYANARAFLLFMYAHPGKKLMFMGNEMGLLKKWTLRGSLPWNDLNQQKYKTFRRFVKDVNHVYLAHPALYANDFDRAGFWWIERQRAQEGVIAFGRNGWTSKNPKKEIWQQEQILAFFNFSDQWRCISYDCHEKRYDLLIDSNWKIYQTGRSDPSMSSQIQGYAEIWLAPYSGRYYRWMG